jgi:hypothetical protein
MAKDPAILWYWNDWHGGTITYTRHLKGCFIDLLHAQFNQGHLSLNDIKTVLGNDFASWGALSKKFTQDEHGLFFNERMDAEVLKRRAFSESRRSNARGVKTKSTTHAQAHAEHMPVHMENESENEITNQIKDEERPVDIWKQPCRILMEDERWWLENITMQVKLPTETIEFALKQYWLALQKENKKGTLQMLRAGFQKWLNTWQLKEKREIKNEQLKNNRKGQPDTGNADAMADRILAQHTGGKLGG